MTGSKVMIRIDWHKQHPVPAQDVAQDHCSRKCLFFLYFFPWHKMAQEKWIL